MQTNTTKTFTIKNQNKLKRNKRKKKKKGRAIVINDTWKKEKEEDFSLVNEDIQVNFRLYNNSWFFNKLFIYI